MERSELGRLGGQSGSGRVSGRMGAVGGCALTVSAAWHPVIMGRAMSDRAGLASERLGAWVARSGDVSGV